MAVVHGKTIWWQRQRHGSGPARPSGGESMVSQKVHQTDCSDPPVSASMTTFKATRKDLFLYNSKRTLINCSYISFFYILIFAPIVSLLSLLFLRQYVKYPPSLFACSKIYDFESLLFFCTSSISDVHNWIFNCLIYANFY